jgi:hypothetical protein
MGKKYEKRSRFLNQTMAKSLSVVIPQGIVKIMELKNQFSQAHTP